ncbi:MAG: glycogen synthase GlgA [Eubacteriales bacterium]
MKKNKKAEAASKAEAAAKAETAPKTETVSKAEPVSKTETGSQSGLVAASPKAVQKVEPTPKAVQKVEPTPKAVQKVEPTPKAVQVVEPAPKAEEAPKAEAAPKAEKKPARTTRKKVELTEEEKAAKRREAAKKAAATRKANAAKKAMEQAAQKAEEPAETVSAEESAPQAAVPAPDMAAPAEEKAEQTTPAAAQEPVEEKAEESAPEQAAEEPASEEEMTPVAEKVRVLVVGAECAPFAKTGGLADVLGTLPKHLNQLGMDVRVMIPFHKVIKDKYRMQTEHVTTFYANLGWKSMFVGVDKLVYDGVTFYFIDNEEMFGGPIYRGGLAEGEQYAFFCRAVVESMDQIGFVPQVVHLNDWHTGMIPMLLKTQYQHRPQGHAKTVFTIHNMMYQGQFSFQQIQDWLGIESRFNTPEFIENYGCASFMKAALVFTDRISTVSPSYAQEIRHPYYAYKLEGILNARAHETWGIVNGINTEEFNPETDICLGHHFNADDLSGKYRVKEDLIRELGLSIWPGTPIMSMVTRLTSQKGIDLLIQVFDEIMQQDVAVVVLGNGEKQYEDFLRSMEYRYKGRVCAYIGYNNELAHRIYAGSDLFLMPSKFEPCGISQMIALRYGTLPIVRETGGLRDTVQPYNEYTDEGNGFSFTNFNAYDMLNVIKYALWVLRDEGKRTNLIQRALKSDNSFAISAQKYYDMFMGLL